MSRAIPAFLFWGIKMIYNKLIKEYEIEYYNIHIPCLYDVDVKCIHKCKLYWSFLTGAINNKKITMQKKRTKNYGA